MLLLSVQNKKIQDVQVADYDNTTNTDPHVMKAKGTLEISGSGRLGRRCVQIFLAMYRK